MEGRTDPWVCLDDVTALSAEPWRAHRGTQRLAVHAPLAATRGPAGDAAGARPSVAGHPARRQGAVATAPAVMADAVHCGLSGDVGERSVSPGMMALVNS